MKMFIVTLALVLAVISGVAAISDFNDPVISSPAYAGGKGGVVGVGGG